MSFRKQAARFIELVKADFGVPATLERVIREIPDMRFRVDEQPPSIARESVVSWHEWPWRNDSELQHWTSNDGIYESYDASIDSLKELGQHETVPDFEFDIRDITGLTNSKSELLNYRSIEEMAKAASPNFIKDLNHAGLDKNLRWPEIRIFGGHDHLVKYAWDEGLYVANSGGSHHLVAAHYIAKTIGLAVPGKNTLRRYSLNAEAVTDLNNRYDIFAIQYAAFSEFVYAMRDFKAGFSWKRLPRPHDEGMAVFLPREDARSVKVAALLHAEQFTNIGQLLSELASPTAALQRHQVKDEMQKRIDAIPSLKNKAGIDYLFGKYANAGMRSGIVAKTDWQAVEHAVLHEAFSEHHLDPNAVYEALSKLSPGAASETARNTLRATVYSFSAFYERNPVSQSAYDSVSPN